MATFSATLTVNPGTVSVDQIAVCVLTVTNVTASPVTVTGVTPSVIPGNANAVAIGVANPSSPIFLLPGNAATFTWNVIPFVPANFACAASITGSDLSVTTANPATLNVTQATPVGSLVLPVQQFQGGTGATTLDAGTAIATGSTTARSLGNRFGDVVNVKDFGAVGDGVTDDTAAFQAWLNAVQSQKKRGRLQAGNYLVTSQLTITNAIGLQISGDGRQATIITGSAGLGASALFLLRGVTRSTFENFQCQIPATSIACFESRRMVADTYAPVYNTFREIWFNGNGVNGVRITKGDLDANNEQFLYDHCQFTNLTGAGLRIEHSNALFHTLRECAFENTGGAVDAPSGSFVVDGGIASNSTNSGPLFSVGTDNTQAQHYPNRVSNFKLESYTGQWLSAGTATGVQVYFQDCKFAGSTVAGSAPALIDINSTGAVLTIVQGTMDASSANRWIKMAGGVSSLVAISNAKIGMSDIQWDGTFASTGNVWATALTEHPQGTATTYHASETGGGIASGAGIAAPGLSMPQGAFVKLNPSGTANVWDDGTPRVNLGASTWVKGNALLMGSVPVTALFVGGGPAGQLWVSGNQADGATAKALVLTSSVNLVTAGAKIVSVANNNGATEVAFVGRDGLGSFSGGLSPGTDALAAQTGRVFQGVGVPNNANGNNGDVYFRTDTPGTASQRVYQKSAGAWIALLGLSNSPAGVVAITVGASPFTYTNSDGVQEAVYISGGTVSAVAKNAITIFAASPASVWLSPGESVTVTYSATPTMTKDQK